MRAFALVVVPMLVFFTTAARAEGETTPPTSTTPAPTPKADDKKAEDGAKPDEKAPVDTSKPDDKNPVPPSKADVAAPVAAQSSEPFPPWADPEPQTGCPDGTLLCFKNEVVAVWPKLRIRPGFEYVDADSQLLYVGENDGFFLDSARIGAEGNVSGVVRFKLTVETASLLPGGQPNQPVTPILAAARDAWVAWTPMKWLVLQAGQQIMPSDYEGGDVEAKLPFTHKSVLAGGVRNGEGNAVLGLSPARQIGIVIGSAEGLHLDDIPLEYRLGISNGNGLNQLGNDNKLPAAYARIGSGYGDLFRVGVGGRFNPRTVGTLPNLYTETDAVLFVDAQVDVANFEAVVEAEGRSTALNTLVPAGGDAGQETADGAALWLSYTVDFTGSLGISVVPAYRISYYDPSSSFAADQLLENTVAVRIDGDAQKMPLSFMIDYTILTELAPARDVADNRLTALFQIEL